MSSVASPSTSDRRGPDGCRYDDSSTQLTIHLVVQGIREKSFMRAANTNVFLKSDESSLSCTIEVVKVDKKKKPPVTSVVDSRYYEVPKFPGEVADVSFKLKTNCCVLTIRKKTPQIWGNELSQFGM